MDVVSLEPGSVRATYNATAAYDPSVTAESVKVRNLGLQFTINFVLPCGVEVFRTSTLCSVLDSIL